jgi:hypothetical protein
MREGIEAVVCGPSFVRIRAFFRLFLTGRLLFSSLQLFSAIL